MMEKAVVVKSMVKETVSATLGIDAVAVQSSNLNKRIEFHLARKSFNGFSNSGEFKIETLNPDPGRRRPDFGIQNGKADSSSDFVENGLDPELNFGITFRRIGAGLENLGNTCFLNSVLQCLTYTEPLAAYLQSGKHQNSCHISGFCALCAIQRHVSRALQASGRSLVPKDLVSNLKCISRNFRNARQEDAHEYMVNLLESMHKCCLPSGVPSESPAAYEKSLVHKIFGGSLRSQVECQQCFYCSNKFDPFLDLSLEILKADSLPIAFQNFTAAELLDGGEKHYQCQQCKQKVRAKKRLSIHKAPHVLTIHLKRFQAYNHGQKVDKKVIFDRSLNLKPFVSGSYEGELRYSLYGVLVHFGHSTRSGHYLCFVRTSSGMWYRLNDNLVCQVSEKTVLEQQAYMLFYVRDRKNDVPVRKENLKPTINGMVTSMPLKQFSKQREDKNSVRNVPSVINSPAAVNHKDTVVNTTSKDARKEGFSVQQIGGPTTCSLLSKGNSHLDTVLESKKENHCPKQDMMEGLKPLLVTRKTAISEPELSTMMIDPKSSSSANVSSSCNGSSSNITMDDVQKNSESANLTAATVCSSEVPSPDVRGKAVENLPSMVTDTQIAHKLDMIKSPTKPSSESIKNGSATQVASGEDAPIAQAADSGLRMLNDLVKPSTLLEGSQRGDTDSRSHKKLKKHPKRRLKNIAYGVKFWRNPLSLRKKMRRKRVKRCALDTQVHIEEQLGISSSSDLGPSTSETSVAHRSDYGKCRRKRPKSSDKGKRCKVKKSSDVCIVGSLETDFIKAEVNGVSLVARKGESMEGDGQAGGVSLMDKQLLNSEADHQCKRNCEIGNSQSGMTYMLSRGLEETTIARWEGVELPMFQIDELDSAQNQSIGYVGDEWDEEYDQGKRKKLRRNKHNFGGPNPFQEIALKNQFMKTKTERCRSGNQPFRL